MQDWELPYTHAANEILAEAESARKKFAPFNSSHEGYAVIAEELDELWDDVKANNVLHAIEEAVQVGAMALRFIADMRVKYGRVSDGALAQATRNSNREDSLMAEITDRKPPAWVPTTNSLADIPDDLLGGPPPPAEIRLGANVLLVMDNPPNVGDYIDLSMRFRISHAGVDQKAPDSDIVHMRRAALVVAWPLGKEMPEPKKTDAELEAEAAAEAAKNQPPLYETDESGLPIHDPEDDDEYRADPANYTPSGLDEFDPQFSHNEGGGR